MKFSVLMSVYHREKPEFFDRAIRSIWVDQTLKPDEVVIVLDGQLTDVLYQIIEKWKSVLGDTLITCSLEQQSGLGKALNTGLSVCSNDAVARMDTDDVALPDRFLKQTAVLADGDVDICSSWIGEFDFDEHNLTSYRKLPETHEAIKSYACRRNPFNHPAVMFKKSIVEKAGGYLPMESFEDYFLWARMLDSGAKGYNIQEVLVAMRAGDAQICRRRGFKYASNELRFFNKLRQINFISNTVFLSNILIRLPFRMLPANILKIVYSYLRR